VSALLRWLWAGQLREQPGRLIAALLAIAIGVALACAVEIVNRSGLDEFSRALAIVNGDAQLRVVAHAASFDEQVYERVVADDRVLEASPSIDVELPWVRADGTARTADSGRARPRSLRVIGVDAFRAARVTPALMPIPAQSGDAASSLFDAESIFLSPAALDALGLHPGDPITLRAGLHGVGLRVAGTVPGAAAGQILAVMDIGALQWHFGWIGRLGGIDLRLREGVDVAAFEREWTERLGAQAGILRPGASVARMSNLSRAYRVNLNVLSLVALLTGGFIVHSTLSLAIARQRRALALLGVMGVPRAWLFTYVLGQGAVLGLAGAAAGLGLGILLARTMLRLVGTDLGGGFFEGHGTALALSPVVLAAIAIAGVAIGIAGALGPARAVSRIAPARAIRGAEASEGPGRRRALAIAAGLFAAGGLLIQAPAFQELPIAAYAAIACWLFGGIALVQPLVDGLGSSLSRRIDALWGHPSLWLGASKVSARGTDATRALGGVVASFALACAMAVMVGSFRISVDTWLATVLPADLYLRAGNAGGQGSLSPDLQRRLRELPGLARAEFLRVQELSLAPDRPRVALIVRAFDAAPASDRIPLTGEIVPAPAGVVPVYVSEAMVDLYGLKPGREASLPIGDGRARFFVRAVWRDYARQHGAIVMDRADYLHLSGDATVNDAALWIAPGGSEEGLLASLRAGIPELDALEVRSARDIRELSLRIFDRSFAITYVLEAIAIVVGLFGVTATYAGEALGRAREFGMMRHLGVTRAQIAYQLAIEASALIAAGTLWGLAIGLAIAWVLVHRVNPQSFHWTMNLSIPVAQLAASAVALVFAGTLAAVFASRQATGTQPLRAVGQDW
jgi:putative ABC transport system permease protein